MKRYSVEVNKKVFDVTLLAQHGPILSFEVAGETHTVSLTPVVTALESSSTQTVGTSGSIVAPLSGLISKINVTEGQEVSAGDILLVIEAMKMENPVKAPHTGTVRSLKVSERDEVKKGTALLTISQ